MKVSELRALLDDVPDYVEVMVGPTFVTEVRQVTRVVRAPERHGGGGVDASVVLVID